MRSKILDKLDTKRIPYFVCIGTELSYADGIAPRIGTRLSKRYKVIGTVGDNVDNVTLSSKIKDIKKIDKSIYQVIAVDCAFHHDYKGVERVVIMEDGIAPGSYLKRNHGNIGDFGIGINLSPMLSSINDFLTNEKRKDVYRIEIDVFNTLNNIIDEYPLYMKVSILLLSGLNKEDIIAELRISLDDYNKSINELLKHDKLAKEVIK